MTRRQRFIASSLFLSGLVWVVGCGSSEQLASVRGTLTVDGKPLPNVEVQFLPDSDKGTIGPASRGVTDSTGSYILVTDDGRPGAVIGEHIIVLTPAATKPKAAQPDEDRGVAPTPRRIKDTSHVRKAPKSTEAAPPVVAVEPLPVATAPFDKEYASTAKTTLRRTVEPGEQVINLEIPAPKPPQVAPPPVADPQTPPPQQ